MASTGGTPERIAVKPQEQAMTHAELASHARAAHGRIGASGPASGLRAEHSALLNAALAQTRSSLDSLARRNDHGAAACKDFRAVEDANQRAVASLENEIPKLT